MIDAGHYALALAWIAVGWTTLASILASLERRESLQRSAERALYAGFALIGFAVFALVRAFVTDDFRVDYVVSYSSSTQPLAYKIGALWGGQSGSLLLWLFLLAGMSAAMVFGNREKNRALMPVATATVGAVMMFFLYMLNVVEPPFASGPMRPDGVGLNPQLKNFWMMIHPPTLYVGYVAFTIPFAFAIAALVTGRTGDVWFRTTRRWTLFAWTFLGTGILLGSYWAYMELGWGGYWAWDPVENASLMPWLVGTAFLHSVMIQERKGMLKVWNMALILLTFNLCLFGTFLTRSGIISSVHAFATSNIVVPFGTFLAVSFFGSGLLLIFRLDRLRSDARIESLVSRESSFLFNNLILVGIAATVLLLTTFPMLNELATGRKVTMGPPIFNLVNVPWALALLLLCGIGPLIAWRRASRANLKRQFLFPALCGGWALAAVSILDARAYGRSAREGWAAIASLDVRAVFEAMQGVYPALTFGIGAFVVGTIVQEYARGVRARRRQRGEPVPLALWRLVGRDRRRYGGYVVHLGMVLIFVGIAGSSAYRQKDEVVLSPGDTFATGSARLVYESWGLDARDDHYGAVTRFSVTRGSRTRHTIAEQRFHPILTFPELRQAFLESKRRVREADEGAGDSVLGLYDLAARIEREAGREAKIPSTEVGLASSMSLLSPSTFGEDVYIVPLAIDPASGDGRFQIYRNPMVNFLWFGGLIFVIGSGICAWPDPRERKRLAAALALESKGQAVA